MNKCTSMVTTSETCGAMGAAMCLCMCVWVGACVRVTALEASGMALVVIAASWQVRKHSFIHTFMLS